MHSSGVLVHPLAVRRSPTDDFLSCLVLFPPFVRLLFLSMSGTHGKPLTACKSHPEGLPLQKVIAHYNP